QYLDDNPSGTAADIYAVSVSVTDDDSGADTAGTSVTVNNLAPTITGLSGPASIDENDTFTLSGTFHDPGTLDTHTIVITWGAGEGTTTITTAGPNPDSTALIYFGNGDWRFTATHQYLDDNPTGTASDTYAISVAVTDDDTG